MSEHEPLEFRYIGFAKDFPAKAALEYVLCRFIDIKRDAMLKSELSDAMVEAGLAVLEEFEDSEIESGTYPNRDIWFRFQYSHDDLVDLLPRQTASKQQVPSHHRQGQWPNPGPRIF